jgi:phosphoethanolamine N-methyltransferase
MSATTSEQQFAATLLASQDFAKQRVLVALATDEQQQQSTWLAPQAAERVVLADGGNNNDPAAKRTSLKSFRDEARFDFVYAAEEVLGGATDEEFVEGVESALRLLKPNGQLFFVESRCFEAGTKRSPSHVINLVQSKAVEEENAITYAFDIMFVTPDRNCEKTYFLFKKLQSENHQGFKTLQEFLDAKQYTSNGILRYEKIFGEGFVSTGGVDTTKVFLERLGLKPGQRVLDVGCGIGGGDFLMAELYGVEVNGLDLSSNMVSIAWERQLANKELLHNVHFQIADVLKAQFEPNSFDLIYSRDTILHINDKRTLFSLFKDWLKPGGKVFITDYCCGPKPWTDDYAKYVAQRGYNLLTVPEYGQLFTDLGYTNVKAIDETDLFVESLKKELVKFEEIKTDFVKDFTQQDYDALVNGWNDKVVRSAAGDQRWGSIYAEKQQQ